VGFDDESTSNVMLFYEFHHVFKHHMAYRFCHTAVRILHYDTHKKLYVIMFSRKDDVASKRYFNSNMAEKLRTPSMLT